MEDGKKYRMATKAYLVRDEKISAKRKPSF